MASLLARVEPEHLTPHDLVTYSRCPHEMELNHRLRAIARGESVAPELSKSCEPHSPLFAPPMSHVRVFEGRIDLAATDTLVYLDEHERGLPVLFPPERVQIDPRFHVHGLNLVDAELRLSGRPDFVIRHADGAHVPLEYKSTHLFGGRLGWHGRSFDVIQAIAECRLVEAAVGVAPPRGMVLYGDAQREGDHEGWMEVEYGESEARWLRYALAAVRDDPVRKPVPHEGHCAPCEVNRERACRYATVPFAHGGRAEFLPPNGRSGTAGSFAVRSP